LKQRITNRAARADTSETFGPRAGAALFGLLVAVIMVVVVGGMEVGIVFVDVAIEELEEVLKEAEIVIDCVIVELP
jgi:hypothetical protein